MRRTGAAVLLTALILGFAAPAQAARAPACPSTVGAQSAIVVEVETGIVACARAADKRLSVGSTTKLMTALLTLEQAELGDTFTAAHYNALPVESKIGLQPGERMRVSDLMRGLLLESGNDAAVTLAEGVSGSRKAFVREMNRRARELKLDQHALREPDRARPGGQLLVRPRPRDAGDPGCARTGSSARSWTPRRGRSRPASGRARSATATGS